MHVGACNYKKLLFTVKWVIVGCGHILHLINAIYLDDLGLPEHSDWLLRGDVADDLEGGGRLLVDRVGVAPVAAIVVVVVWRFRNRQYGGCDYMIM